MRWRVGPALLFSLCLAVAGCGGGEDVAGREQEAPGAGAAGALDVVVEAPPADLDPLTSEGAGALIARQITEPLLGLEVAPYERAARARGPAAGAVTNDDGGEWQLRLRRDIRFHDGALLDAQAVLANIDRWLASAVGSRLLEGVVAADAPRPDLVRVFCDPPQPDLARRLSDRRLGLVSPGNVIGGSDALAGDPRGTAAFELRETDEERVVLVRNVRWWGTRGGLGPAYDQIRVAVERDPRARFDSLVRGDADLAELTGETLDVAAMQPLVRSVGRIAGTEMAASRALRGLSPQGPMSGAWPTTVGAGG